MKAPTEDDPNYIKMLNKSFIMNKHYQRHPRQPIPQIQKQQTIVHKVLTTGVLSTLIHLVAFPLDTIKVRKMAKHKLVDVARFDKNQVFTLTPYLGFFKGYLSIIIGNMCFMTLGQVNFLAGVLGQGLLKTWVDMSKISSQMGNQTMNMQISRKAFLPACFFSVMRDLSSRGSYMLLIDFFFKQNKLWLQKDPNRRYHVYFGSAILSTLVSHPFDLLFTKVASQRQHRYRGILGTIRTVIKEQGIGKLYSAMDYRLFYSLVSVIIMGTCYDQLMLMTLDAL